MKIHFRIKNVPVPINNIEAASTLYVDTMFIDPSIIKNSALVDFNDKNPDNVRLVKINSLPAVREHVTAKFYVDQAISNSVGEPTLVGNNQDKIFNICNLTNLDTITLNTQAIHHNQVIIKSYVEKIHHENQHSRRY